MLCLFCLLNLKKNQQQPIFKWIMFHKTTNKWMAFSIFTKWWNNFILVMHAPPLFEWWSHNETFKGVLVTKKYHFFWEILKSCFGKLLKLNLWVRFYSPHICTLPVRFELFWLWPKLRVAVQSVDWNHNKHVLWDCGSIYLDSFFGYSFQTWNWRVEPIDKTRIFLKKSISLSD